jgi:hypothetical protein
MFRSNGSVARPVFVQALRFLYPLERKNADPAKGFVILLVVQAAIFLAAVRVGQVPDLRLMLFAPLILVGLLEQRSYVHALTAITVTFYTAAAFFSGAETLPFYAGVNFAVTLLVALLIAETSRFAVETLERVSRLALTLERETQKLRHRLETLDQNKI